MCFKFKPAYIGYMGNRGLYIRYILYCFYHSWVKLRSTHVVVVRALEDEGYVDGFVAVVDDGGRLHRDPAQRLVTRCEKALERATRGRP